MKKLLFVGLTILGLQSQMYAMQPGNSLLDAFAALAVDEVNIASLSETDRASLETSIEEVMRATGMSFLQAAADPVCFKALIYEQMRSEQVLLARISSLLGITEGRARSILTELQELQAMEVSEDAVRNAMRIDGRLGATVVLDGIERQRLLAEEGASSMFEALFAQLDLTPAERDELTPHLFEKLSLTLRFSERFEIERVPYLRAWIEESAASVPVEQVVGLSMEQVVQRLLQPSTPAERVQRRREREERMRRADAHRDRSSVGVKKHLPKK